MKFNLRILDGRNHYNDRPCYYYIGTGKEESVDHVNSLAPTVIYGESFKELRKTLRIEHTAGNQQCEMTPAMKKRFSTVEAKVATMLEPSESIYRVYFHYNSEMSKPMILVCVGVNTGAMCGLERGRVIVSGVDTVVEKDHYTHNNRCDYFVGKWDYTTSSKGKPFINIDCTRREDEKAVAVRGCAIGINTRSKAVEAVQVVTLDDFIALTDDGTEHQQEPEEFEVVDTLDDAEIPVYFHDVHSSMAAIIRKFVKENPGLIGSNANGIQLPAGFNQAAKKQQQSYNVYDFEDLDRQRRKELEQRHAATVDYWQRVAA